MMSMQQGKAKKHKNQSFNSKKNTISQSFEVKKITAVAGTNNGNIRLHNDIGLQRFGDLRTKRPRSPR